MDQINQPEAEVLATHSDQPADTAVPTAEASSQSDVSKNSAQAPSEAVLDTQAYHESVEAARARFERSNIAALIMATIVDTSGNLDTFADRAVQAAEALQKRLAR